MSMSMHLHMYMCIYTWAYVYVLYAYEHVYAWVAHQQAATQTAKQVAYKVADVVAPQWLILIAAVNLRQYHALAQGMHISLWFDNGCSKQDQQQLLIPFNPNRQWTHQRYSCYSDSSPGRAMSQESRLNILEHHATDETTASSMSCALRWVSNSMAADALPVKQKKHNTVEAQMWQDGGMALYWIQYFSAGTEKACVSFMLPFHLAVWDTANTQQGPLELRRDGGTWSSEMPQEHRRTWNKKTRHSNNTCNKHSRTHRRTRKRSTHLETTREHWRCLETARDHMSTQQCPNDLFTKAPNQWAPL